MKNDVLLISPLQTAMCCSLFGEEQSVYSANYRMTVENLIDAGIGFDIFDDSFLDDTAVADGKFIVNGKPYSVVILPKMLTLSRGLYKKLRDFPKKEKFSPSTDFRR